MRRHSRRLGRPPGGRMRRVLLAFGLFSLIEFATWMAIILVAYDLGGAVLVGVVSVAMQLPAIVGVPLLAGWGDRANRGMALALAHLAVALTSLMVGGLLLAGAPLWLVVAVASVQLVAINMVRPMHFAALPGLAVRPGDLVAANGLSSALEGVAVFVGFAAGGLITGALGAWVVLALGGLIGLVAALLTSRLRILDATPARSQDGPATQVRSALAGVAALRRAPGALALLALLACTYLVVGATDVLAVAFNDEILELDEATAGVLAGAYGLGLAIGGATQANLAHRPRLAPVVLAGVLLLGLAEAAIVLLNRLGPAAVMLGLTGVGMSLIVVSARTLLQRGTDQAVLARVLAVQESVGLAGLILGAVVAPLAIVALGPRWAFLPFGALVVVLGLSFHRSISSLDATAPVRAREVEALRSVPFLAALPAYEVARLAQAAVWRTVGQGVDVVRQGDLGDAYYLVVSGELSVTVSGRRKEHVLGPGEGFGEISLLRRVPRTATVTALGDCELLMIGSAQFLGAVASDATGAALAAEHSTGRLTSDGVPPG